MKFFFSNVLIVLFFFFSFLSLGIYFLEFQYQKDGPLDSSIIVNIAKGENLIDISNILEKKGIIDEGLIFVFVSKFKGLSNKIKYGEYLIEENISLENLLRKLTKGIPFQRKITIPEGLSSRDIILRLNNDIRIEGKKLDNVSEGVLAPNTYSFDIKMDKKALLKRMLLEQENILKSAWNNRLSGLPLKSSADLIILASIIEKEASNETEKAIIASVFINRLKAKMRLQSDPTVIYALMKGEGPLGRKLTKKDLRVSSKFNTYKIKGLPPSPICNPGKDAIIAASQPATTDFLYFVADGRGGHNFSQSLEQHNKYVAEYRKTLVNK